MHNLSGLLIVLSPDFQDKLKESQHLISAGKGIRT